VAGIVVENKFVLKGRWNCAKVSSVLSGRNAFVARFPATMWLANFRLSPSGRNFSADGNFISKV
jgi:hypothetical protein